MNTRKSDLAENRRIYILKGVTPFIEVCKIDKDI